MRYPALTLLVAVLCSCSILFDPEVDELPCDSEGRCAAGYSCLVNTCVAEGSVHLGATCSADVQCEDDDSFCGTAPFLCRKACYLPYEDVGECGPAEYCRPEPAPPGGPAVRAGCVPSECSPAIECRRGTTCARVAVNAGACVAECAYGWDATPEYSDNCDEDGWGPRYCQPIGLATSPTLACLPLYGEDLGGDEGAACSPVEAPCRLLAAGTGIPTGLTCDGDVCRRLCEAGAAVCGGGVCCPVLDGTSATIYSVCKPAC